MSSQTPQQIRSQARRCRRIWADPSAGFRRPGAYKRDSSFLYATSGRTTVAGKDEYPNPVIVEPMSQASVTDSCACETEPSSDVCFLVVTTCRAVCPKISFRSPVSVVVVSICNVGLSEI